MPISGSCQSVVLCIILKLYAYIISGIKYLLLKEIHFIATKEICKIKSTAMGDYGYLNKFTRFWERKDKEY